MARYQLLLPKMGESVAEATIIKWLKKPGDFVEADEAVMEIATDKVDSEVPSPVAGRLAEQLCREDDVVQVGAVIAMIETAVAEEVKAPAPVAPAPEVRQEPVAPVVVPTPAPVYAEQAPAPVAAQQPAITEPKVETYNPSQAAQVPAAPIPGTEQLAQAAAPKTAALVSDTVRFYSPLVRSIASQEGIGAAELDRIQGTGAEGRLTKDDLLYYIRNRSAGAAASTADNGANFAAAPEQVAAPVIEAIPVDTLPEPESKPAEPVAATVAPSAPKPEPVAAPKPAPATEQKPQAAPAPKPASSVAGGDEIIEMDRMRKLIAEHMVYSKHTSPHVTSFVEADVTNLVLWREKIKSSFEKREGEKITFTPIFIEAVVKAIKDMPMINVSVSGTQIIKKKDINISMATALPSGNLIVPVIKKADELNLLGITKAVNDLANRARTGKLLPDDVKDGTFTITNVGSFGNVMGTPIINQPQVAILAVGAIKKKPAVIETKQGDMIGIRHMMFLSLSYDHRVVDGALGGSFVRKVADYLENWDFNREV